MSMYAAMRGAPVPGARRGFLALRSFFAPAALVTLLLPQSGLTAQSVRDLGLGDRVRMTPIEGSALKGSFQGIGPSGLRLSEKNDGPFTIPFSVIRSLELATGKKRGKAALIGGAIGIVAGVLLGGATSGDCVGDCRDPYGVGGGGLVEANATAQGAALGGIILGAVGAGVGALFFAPERWIRVDLGPSGGPAT